MANISQEDLELHAKRVKELMIEVQTSGFGHAQTYTTVVIFGGYAALFAIWSFTKDFLTDPTVFWVGLLLGTSVLTYVMYEIFAMFRRSVEFLQIRQVLVRVRLETLVDV